MYDDILAGLEETMEQGKIDGHAVYTIILMSRHIIKHVTAGYDRIRERLGNAIHIRHTNIRNKQIYRLLI